MNTIRINSAVNGDTSYRQNIPLTATANETMDVEIHQRYIRNGEYRYFIRIDGEEVHSVVNTQARQFYNVKVLAAPAFTGAYTCPASIKDVKHTDFI